MTHNRMVGIIFLALVGIFVALVGANGLLAATCTGSDPCHACKNCRYCKVCAKQGGTCGLNGFS
jgi:hypothetical protein